MQKPPIEDVIKALVEAGLPADEIASTVAKMFGSGGDEIAKVADEVVQPKSASVIPKLVEEGKPLPAAVKISTAEKKAKLPRIGFDEQIHAGEPTKFSDILSKDEYAGLSDKELKRIRNQSVHAYNTKKLTEVKRAESAAKSAENKAKHAATRTPEARREAAAAQSEYFKRMKKGDK